MPSPGLHEFESCLNDRRHKSIVENDTKFAFASGFQGTPTFIVEKRDGSDQKVLEHILSLHSKQSLIKSSLRADLFK